MGHNELLIGEALRGRRARTCLLSVKFGAQRGPGGAWLGYDASPAAVKTALAYTLQPPRRRPHRHLPPGPPGPERADRGHRSEPSPNSSRPATCATSACPRWAPRPSAARRPSTRSATCRSSTRCISRGIEAEILPDVPRTRDRRHRLRRTSAAGCISGHFAADRELPADDFRAHAPRFAGREPRAQPRPRRRAARGRRRPRGVTVAQVAIAWVLGRGRRHRPARRRAHAASGSRRRSARSTSTLDAEDLAALERAVPPDAAAGDRYAARADGRARQRTRLTEWRSRSATWAPGLWLWRQPHPDWARGQRLGARGLVVRRASPAASASCSTRSRRRPPRARPGSASRRSRPTRSSS